MRISGRKPFSWRFTSPLYVGSSLNPVNSALIATALVPIADGLHVSAGSTAVLVTSLYLASAIAQPTAGKLAEVLGPRRIFLADILLVLLGGLVGGFGTNLAMLIVARVLIGVGTSAGYPSAMVLIRRRATEVGLDAPPGGVLGGVAIAGMATAAVGPPLGGLLVGAVGWHWAFLINIPVTVIALAMALRWVPKDPLSARGEHAEGRGFQAIARRIDLAGILGIAATMTALIIFLMGLPNAGWIAFAVFVAAAWPSTGLVFTTRTGRPVEPRNLVRSFARICGRNGIRRIRVHAIRHTAASLLKDLKVRARDAQIIPGHAHPPTRTKRPGWTP